MAEGKQKLVGGNYAPHHVITHFNNEVMHLKVVNMKQENVIMQLDSHAANFFVLQPE